MKALVEELFRSFHELARKDDHRIRSLTQLFVDTFAHLNQELSDGVGDTYLSQDGGCKI